MGHRIELSEIEIAVNALEFVDAACCIYDTDEEKIVLFYQSKEPCDREVVTEAGKILPKYMLPNRMVHMNAMPMTKNAKIDRIALKKEFIDND